MNSEAPRPKGRGISFNLQTLSSPSSKIPLEFSGDGGGLISPRLIKVGVMPFFTPSPNPSSPRRRLYEPEAIKGGEFKRMPFSPALKGGAFWHIFVKGNICKFFGN